MLRNYISSSISIKKLRQRPVTLSLKSMSKGADLSLRSIKSQADGKVSVQELLGGSFLPKFSPSSIFTVFHCISLQKGMPSYGAHMLSLAPPTHNAAHQTDTVA